MLAERSNSQRLQTTWVLGSVMLCAKGMMCQSAAAVACWDRHACREDKEARGRYHHADRPLFQNRANICDDGEPRSDTKVPWFGQQTYWHHLAHQGTGVVGQSPPPKLDFIALLRLACWSWCGRGGCLRQSVSHSHMHNTYFLQQAFAGAWNVTCPSLFHRIGTL
eukprot:6085393-Amphidinium_carterae.2